MAENTHPVGTPPGGERDKRVGTQIKTNYIIRKAYVRWYQAPQRR